ILLELTAGLSDVNFITPSNLKIHSSRPWLREIPHSLGGAIKSTALQRLLDLQTDFSPLTGRNK
ncbi:hypothetical protein CCH79_00002725, partial [Gambusia affinis]